MATSGDGVQLSTVHNAFNIVEAVAQKGEVGVTELAEDLDMHKSTVHTYLQTLVDAGYLVQPDKTYQISLEFMRLGVIARGSELYEASLGEISKLATKAGERANLGIPERGYVYVIRVTDTRKAQLEGRNHHMHATGLGKAILAHLPADRVSSIIEQHGLPELTRHTITDEGELFEELETIRNQGYAVDAEECSAGAMCFAAPITDSAGRALAAIGVTGPPDRLSQDEYSEELITELRRNADAIEAKLGYS
jgi:IclR family acetate operon transcriptional repressor